MRLDRSHVAGAVSESTEDSLHGVLRSYALIRLESLSTGKDARVVVHKLPEDGQLPESNLN